MMSLAACVTGFFLDRLFGDPVWLYHPVRMIGNMISFLEKRLRKENDKKNMTAGGVLWIIVAILSFGIPFAGLRVAQNIHPLICFFLESFWCYQIFAAKSLSEESKKVYYCLKRNDMKEARRAVSMIVGRDTENLTEEGVTKAAVETVAENTSDGVIAPMLYTAIGGPVLGFVYKAVNTMDSMLGYKNDKYMYFGRFAARLDDVVNFIPARISAYLMIAAAFIGGRQFDGKNAYHIFKRDRFNHASPNSAQTESVCAGALRVQLAGDAVYFGKLVKKKYIGDGLREIEYEDIKRANRLMYITAFLCELLSVAVMSLVLILL